MDIGGVTEECQKYSEFVEVCTARSESAMMYSFALNMAAVRKGYFGHLYHCSYS